MVSFYYYYFRVPSKIQITFRIRVKKYYFADVTQENNNFFAWDLFDLRSNYGHLCEEKGVGLFSFLEMVDII